MIPRPAPPAAVRLPARTRLVISLLLVSSFVVSSFVVILNETIISVAIPVIMTDLAITAATGQWLATAFMLTMAVVISITGFTLLVPARVVEDTGTAMMMPLLMTTLMTVVPPAARGRLTGVRR